MFVSLRCPYTPKFICWDLIPKVMISVLIRGQRDILLSFHYVRLQGETGCLNLEKSPHQNPTMHSDLKFLTSEIVRNERLLFKPPSLTCYGSLNGLRHIRSVPIYNWFVRNRLLNAAGKDNSPQLHTGAWIDGAEIHCTNLAAQAKGILYCPRRLHTCLAVLCTFWAV